VSYVRRKGRIMPKPENNKKNLEARAMKARASKSNNNTRLESDARA